MSSKRSWGRCVLAVAALCFLSLAFAERLQCCRGVMVVFEEIRHMLIILGVCVCPCACPL
jgi:hypothetical protein